MRQKLIASSFKNVQLPEQLEKAKKKSKKRKAESSTPSTSSKKTKKSTSKTSSSSKGGGGKSPKNMMIKKSNGQLKARITSNGNKKMSIPDDVFPELCRRISANGTGERVSLINKFCEDYPTISMRQVTLKLSEITTRERVNGKFIFYLRPRFYPLLPEEERPSGWKEAAEEDERKWKEEKLANKAASADKEEKKKDTATTTSRDSNAGSIVATSEDDDTEDDDVSAPPPKKKTKLDP